MHKDVLCLNAFAPAFYPKGFAHSVSGVLNGSAYLHSSDVGGSLSRLDKDDCRLTVKYPLSLEGFREGLADCPDMELIQFVLDGIQNGVRLGPLDGTVDTDLWCCKNGLAVKGQRLSYERSCRMKWPGAISWAHLLANHLRILSARQLVLFLSVLLLRCVSFITCLPPFMVILLMH